MEEHNLIIKVIDAYYPLRSIEEKNIGVCFGLTLTILTSFFAGNFPQCEEAIDSMTELFPSSAEAEIKKNIKKYEALLTKKNKSSTETALVLKFIDFVAFLNHVVIMHRPDQYKQLFDQENLTDIENQQGSMKATTSMILFKPSDPEKQENVTIHEKFTHMMNEREFNILFKRINTKLEDEPIKFGCTISNIGHTIGFLYEPSHKEWILIEVNPWKVIKRFTTIEAIASAAWAALSDQQLYRPIHIVPISLTNTADSAEGLAESYKFIFDFSNYNADQIAQLFASTYWYDDFFLREKILNKYYINLDKYEPEAVINTILNQTLYTLHTAIENNHLDIARVLISQADNQLINQTDENNQTPLICSVRSHQHFLTKVILKNKNVDVMSRDINGKQAIYYAALFGFYEIFTLLALKIPADKILSDSEITLPDNLTLFQFAAKNDYYEVMELLLNYKVDINQATLDGCTPLHYAAMHGNFHCVELLLKQPSIKIDAINNNGNTALYEAAFKDSIRIINLFIKKIGTETDLKSYIVHTGKNWTLLHCAAAYGNHKLMQKMMDLGADINQPTSDKSTPLHLAAMHGNIGAVKILLAAKGLNLQAKNSDNKTASECESTSHGKYIKDLILQAETKNSSATSHLLLACSRFLQAKSGNVIERKRKFDVIS